jgi:hypothetical protein
VKQFRNLSSCKRSMVAIDKQIIEFHASWEQQMKCRVRPRFILTAYEDTIPIRKVR